MTIPLIAFLYLYLLFVLVWLIFSIIALYHIIKYGQINFTSFAATFLYCGVSIVILYLSYGYLSQLDWSAGLTIFQGGFFVTGFNSF